MIYDAFARKCNKPVVADLQRSDLLGDKGYQLGAEFAVYLLSLRQPNGRHYSVGTKDGYFRGWLSGLHKSQKFKATVTEARNTWVPDVAKKLETRACVDAIRRGEPIFKRKRPIRRALLKKIVRYALEENGPDAYETRAVLAMLRSSVGRSGEVSTANWEFSEWSGEEEVLLMNWPEVKTGTEETLSYGPDIDWELDVIHSIASYVVTNQARASTSGDVNWLFPSYSKLSGNNASAKVNNFIRSCVGKVRPLIELNNQLTSKNYPTIH